MALENKAQKAKREALEALPRIVHATLDTAGAGYTFCTREITDYLSKNGLAEGNEEILNEAGAIACRATEKGVEKVMSENQVVETPAVAKPVFEIEEGIAIPTSKRGGRKEATYPFDALQVGQSFFIAPSEKHPEPAKSLASTVSGATKRYDIEVEGTREVTNPKTKEVRTVQNTAHTREFIIRPFEKDGVKGARVFRAK